MLRAISWPSLGFALLAAACGARDSLQVSDAVTSAQASGPGGAGGRGGSGPGGSVSVTAGSSSSGVVVTPSCDALVVIEPIVAAATPPLARAPEIGTLPSTGEVFLSYIEAPPSTPGVLGAGQMKPFATWPPEITGLVDLTSDVLDYITGPGPEGPVALIRHGMGESSHLAMQLLPQIDGISLFTGSDDVLFAAAIPDRYLAAQLTLTPGYHVLQVGSYQPSSLPQNEEPLLCLLGGARGAGVPSGSGFLVALSEPDPPEPGCSLTPPPGSVVSLMRYESPAEPGSFLVRTQGDRIFTRPDPLARILLTPASFGAWVVFQSEGSPSVTPPPIFAARVGANGKLLAPNEPPVAVSPDSVVSSPIAATALGDSVAVAWIENLDPSSPVIVVQIVRPDGSLGAATSFPTANLWLTGQRMGMVASADATSLLLAWEGGLGEPHLGLARIDCVMGL